MATVAKKYLEYVAEILNKTIDTQEEALENAAEIVSKSCENGGRFYVFGSGHSHMVAEEIYIRAGGLAYVRAILPPELMLHEMPNKSTWLERLDGYSEALLKLYKVDEKDTIMIVSNSGRNSVPVEMALGAKALGAKVIAMTSMEHSTQTTSRHKSGKKLYEIADVVLDNCSLIGDAAVEIDGFEMKVGSTSTIPNIFLQNAILVQMVELLVQKGITPDVYYNGHMAFMKPECANHNDKLVDKYFYRIRNL